MAQKRKKTSRKKTSQSRAKKTRLTAGDTEHFKQMLLEKRREIVMNVNEREDEALKKSRLDASGDLSSMPIHMAELGSENVFIGSQAGFQNTYGYNNVYIFRCTYL